MNEFSAPDKKFYNVIVDGKFYKFPGRRLIALELLNFIDNKLGTNALLVHEHKSNKGCYKTAGNWFIHYSPEVQKGKIWFLGRSDWIDLKYYNNFYLAYEVRVNGYTLISKNRNVITKDLIKRASLHGTIMSAIPTGKELQAYLSDKKVYLNDDDIIDLSDTHNIILGCTGPTNNA